MRPHANLAGETDGGGDGTVAPFGRGTVRQQQQQLDPPVDALSSMCGPHAKRWKRSFAATAPPAKGMSVDWLL